MNNLAIVYDEQGKYPQAEALYSQTLEIRRRVLGPEHPDTLGSMNNLAIVYYAAGQVRAGRGALQPDPGDPAPRAGSRASRHADFHEQSGRTSTAKQGKYASGRGAPQPDPGDQAPRARSGASRHAGVHEQSGRRLHAAGQVRAGRGALSQTLEIQRRVLGPEHPDTLAIHEQSGRRLRCAGQVCAGRGALQPDPGDPAPRAGSRAS